MIVEQLFSKLIIQSHTVADEFHTLFLVAIARSCIVSTYYLLVAARLLNSLTSDLGVNAYQRRITRIFFVILEILCLREAKIFVEIRQLR